ncbi:MAG: tetratricopeptide repeat protein [Cytophagales bacterium]|nr:tetratricopeptide repeat protein [Rhizobacter sp.]
MKHNVPHKPGSTQRPVSGAARLAQRQLLQRAVDLLRDKMLDEAEPLLLSVLQRWPGQADALHFLGVLEHTRGHSEAALTLIRQAIAGMPGQPGPLNNLGNVLVETQRFDEAVTAYRDSLALKPDNIDALNNLATMLRKRGEHAESEALCRRALETKPDFALAWYNLSLTLLEQGRVDEGLSAHSRAIVLWPRHLQARNAVPKALVQLGRLDEAARLYREWLATDPDNPVIKHHLAACSGGAVPERASDAYVERTFDAFAATFDANLSALGYRAPQLVADLLRELLPPPARQFDIHDLGCGTGLCGPMVRDWARDLSGCDLSQGMLDKAERRHVYDSLHRAELVAHMRAHPARFDALICADTFCYFGELGEAMRAAVQALRAGGHLVFTVEASQAEDGPPYRLLPHGRYAHQRDYVSTALAAAGLQKLVLREEQLRSEGGKPVIGWLVAARVG